MQNGTVGGMPAQCDDRHDIYHTVVADLASLIERIQASLTLIDAAVARETSVALEEMAANVVVLDDVTPMLPEGRRGAQGVRCRPCRRPALSPRADGGGTRYARFRRNLALAAEAGSAINQVGQPIDAGSPAPSGCRLFLWTTGKRSAFVAGKPVPPRIKCGDRPLGVVSQEVVHLV